MIDSSLISRRGPNTFSRISRDAADDVGELVLGAGEVFMVVVFDKTSLLWNVVDEDESGRWKRKLKVEVVEDEEWKMKSGRWREYSEYIAAENPPGPYMI